MARIAGGNKDVFKRMNRGLLLQLLATRQCASRSELSRVMGLSKMAISNMVNELMALGYLVDGRATPNEELGRNPSELNIAPSAPKAVGVLIFRDRCEAVLCDLNLTILTRRSMPMRAMSREMLLDQVCTLIDGVLEGADKVLGIGVAAICPLDTANGVIRNPEYFYGIKDVPVVERLTERYGLPVWLENDNQCGVLAEELYGNGRGCSNIILLGIARGVGCGLVVDGELYHNGQGLMPEFGHVSIDYRGRPCSCGNRGCIEAYLSTHILLDELQAATGQKYDFQTFCQMDTNLEVSRILSKAVDRLAAALVSTINLLNLELVILAYDSACLSDGMLLKLERKLNENKFAKHAGHIRVVRPRFMQDAQLLGGACMVIMQLFSGELLEET